MTQPRRINSRVKLYFNCLEKMDQIERMCKHTNYKDMTVIISTIGARNLTAKHRIQFGMGWMGKDIAIKGVSYNTGIHILITISESVDVIDCWLESPEDRIHLGEPTDILYDWFLNSVILTELEEGLEEMRVRRREETEEEREMRQFEEIRADCKFFDELRKNGEPTETLVRAGMKNVLLGKD